MHGILKVLYGTVRISCMDKLEVGSGQRPRAPPPEQQFEPPLQPRERDAVQPGVLRSRKGRYGQQQSQAPGHGTGHPGHAGPSPMNRSTPGLPVHHQLGVHSDSHPLNQ